MHTISIGSEELEIQNWGSCEHELNRCVIFTRKSNYRIKSRFHPHLTKNCASSFSIHSTSSLRDTTLLNYCASHLLILHAPDARQNTQMRENNSYGHKRSQSKARQYQEIRSNKEKGRKKSETNLKSDEDRRSNSKGLQY
ncbi:hypothetical protein AAZX31_13G079400 [Glycine max]